ncbi:xanthine dehydrogenase accessory factor XdhC [Gottschalkia acidurici 9a]|uniref:Xanthine dehydrogenase accessory factor XdhC n=1 Tax=Gottschalkia acidurici (strain ATCC 7906 / DSM 604 / BCRC 14475 / CIP 104303 / KCTC 5404 / NCIMB 10678 / 9a) TaxID=1128398 RepID=K0B333_GOTA9|nr:XdhC/CoxI family protein [Gottschalkia acidurici]AFS79864.1 xanthine dehydrogenase accessory factor XdhC [Gottschalkia acidurici 9a]
MDTIVLKRVYESIKKNNKIALVMVTNVKGVTPARVGLSMCVTEDGFTIGTVGGGKMEFEVVNKSLECLKSGISETFCYKQEVSEVAKIGDVEIGLFIKVFNPKEKLLIVGGGHVGFTLYQIAKSQDFYTVIFDSREEFCNKDRFPEADELHVGDIEENLKRYNIDEKCYIVASGHEHKQDEIVVKSCIDRGAKYLGMLGSSKKIKTIKENLMKEGISKESLEKVYMPIGLNMGGDSLKEIAFGIFGEILVVKNNAKIDHMKNIKNKFKYKSTFN